jgi:hypothetical protein
MTSVILLERGRLPVQRNISPERDHKLRSNARVLPLGAVKKAWTISTEPEGE